MGTGDGTVLGTTKIVDHGPATARWNMVILGDGYQASEINKYHADVQNFVNTLYNTAPFNQEWCGINIHRVDVTSTDSGADDPATCGDGSGGSGVTARTYFDASFCNSGIRRLLEVDSASARNVALAQVPQMNMTMVIVNTTEYGGSGGSVATFSLAPNAAEIGIHEMGHTAFGFADEYEYYAGCGSGETGHDHYTGGEPTQPNVTIDTNRATNKWRNLILPATAMPTTQNADCSKCDPQANPVSATTVGTFEGANYNHCGCYRPQYTCRMRALSNPFCAVCQQVIVQALTPYVVPTTVNLTTPSIAFTNIPEGIGGTGVTTFRAVVFEVTSCSPITLHITALTSSPASSFNTPLGTSITVPPGEFTSVTDARLWLSYTSTTAGASSVGSVTVHCDETGQTWVIPIVANTVARPKAAVSFVFDHSGSMIEDAGDGTTKVQKLREAANIFVNVMLQGDGIGIVRFDDASQILMPITDVGPAVIGGGRTTAQGIINSPQLDPAGSTSIGAGVVNGKQALDTAQALGTPHYDVTAMVVLTDGEENTAPFLSAVGSSITANTFAVGLGIPANISTAALATLTQGHNGYLLITGSLTPDQSSRLAKYFLQILAGITNANVVLDPQGYLVYGAEQRIPFIVTEADMGLDVILLSPAPYAIDFELETPDGSRLTPASAGATIQFVSASEVSYYRLSLPALPPDPSGSHAGTWNAILRLGRKERSPQLLATLAQAQTTRALPYNLVVHSYSNLDFRATLQQTGFEPGATVTVVARLTEYDFPLEGRAAVRAEITRPDGSGATLALVEEAGGRFVTSFIADQSGLYTLRVRANGVTLRNSPFTREQTLSAAVYPGGNRPPDPGVSHDKCICDLLQCLVSNKVIGGALRRELADRGINLNAFEECLSAYCRCADAGIGEWRDATAVTAPFSTQGVAQFLQQPEVRAILGQIVRELAAAPPATDFASLPQGEPSGGQAPMPPVTDPADTEDDDTIV